VRRKLLLSGNGGDLLKGVVASVRREIGGGGSGSSHVEEWVGAGGRGLVHDTTSCLFKAGEGWRD
jgi:hypothetical protein